MELLELLGSFGNAPPIQKEASTSSTSSDRLLGIVERFESQKGFGSIRPANGGEMLFAHWSKIKTNDKWPVLQVGMEVMYTPGYEKGKVVALDITDADGNPIGNLDEMMKMFRETSDFTCTGTVVEFDAKLGNGKISLNAPVTWLEELPAGHIVQVERSELVVAEGCPRTLLLGMQIQFKLFKALETGIVCACDVTKVGGKPLDTGKGKGKGDLDQSKGKGKGDNWIEMAKARAKAKHDGSIEDQGDMDMGDDRVLEFIIENNLDSRAQEAFLSCSPAVQKAVIARGTLKETRNPSSALIGRIQHAESGGGNGKEGKGVGKADKGKKGKLLGLMAMCAAALGGEKRKADSADEGAGDSDMSSFEDWNADTSGWSTGTNKMEDVMRKMMSIMGGNAPEEPASSQQAPKPTWNDWNQPASTNAANTWNQPATNSESWSTKGGMKGGFPGFGEEPPKKKPRVLCVFFAGGKCGKGDACTFSHDILNAEEPKPMSCKFFKQGICAKGVMCPFLHDAEAIEQGTAGCAPCKYFQMGKCNKGELCPFSHDLSQSASAMLPAGNSMLPPGNSMDSMSMPFMESLVAREGGVALV